MADSASKGATSLTTGPDVEKEPGNLARLVHNETHREPDSDPDNQVSHEGFVAGQQDPKNKAAEAEGHAEPTQTASHKDSEAWDPSDQGNGPDNQQQQGSSTQEYASSDHGVARAGDTAGSSSPEPGQSSVQADKEAKFAVPPSTQPDHPKEVFETNEQDNATAKTEDATARPTAPGLTTSGSAAGAAAESEKVKEEMKQQPGVQLTLPGANIPFNLSRSAAIKERYARLEIPITGIPGTRENQKPVKPRGQFLVANRSKKDIEQMMPRLAEFLNTFNPYINIGVLTALAFVGWGVGTIGFSWIWVAIAAAAGGWYFHRVRDRFMKKPKEVNVKIEEAVLSLGKGVETAEWLNFFVAQIWPVIDPILFQAGLDQVEEIAKKQAPAPIERVWIDTVEFGSRAPRVTSVQVHPSSSGDDAILMDMSVAMYPSPQELASKKRLNTYVLTKIRFGHPKLGKIDFPILVEQIGFEAQIRMHLQLMSQAPFAKALSFTLLNTPKFNFAVRPGKKLDLMNLPLLSQGVNGIIETAMNQIIVSPKVMSLELDKILGGQRDSKAIGVIKIVFREAKGLRRADWMGSSDPYATLGLGSSHRFLARTRVIPRDLHPVWNETHYCLITNDDVRNGFPLSVRVFDFDAVGYDDTLGQFSMRLEEVAKSEGVLFDGWKGLLGRKDADKKGKGKKKDEEGEEAIGKTGKINFQIGYFPKLDIKTRKEDAQKFTGGILQLHIHQCTDLLLKSKDKYGLFVSPYVHAFVNGKREFGTRVKQNNPSPIFNTSTEVFLRDWTTARVRFVVKDYRFHEHDPVIGVVVLQLGEIFKNSGDMSYTAWHHLESGIGFGKLRIGITFTPVRIEEPDHLKGYDVGELEVQNFKINGLERLFKDNTTPPTTHLVIRSPVTNPSKITLSHSTEATFSPNWGDEGHTIRVPHRYQTALRFEVRQRGLVGGHTLAVGKMFLQDIADNEEKKVVLQLRKFRRRGKDEDNETSVEGSLGSTEVTKPGDINPTVTDPEKRGEEEGKGDGSKETLVEHPDHQGESQADADDNTDDETGWASDTDSVVSEGDTDSVASDEDWSGDQTTQLDRNERPTLEFDACFRPGLTWVSAPREGDELEMLLLGTTSDTTPDAQKRITKQTGAGKTKRTEKLKESSKFLSIFGGSSGTVKSTAAQNKVPEHEDDDDVSDEKKEQEEYQKRLVDARDKAKEKHSLGGNSVTRTVVWGKDQIGSGMKKSKIWRRFQKRSLPQYADEG